MRTNIACVELHTHQSCTQIHKHIYLFPTTPTPFPLIFLAPSTRPSHSRPLAPINSGIYHRWLLGAGLAAVMVVSSEAFLPVAVPSLRRASPLAAMRSSGGLKLGRRLSKTSLRMNLQVCALFFSQRVRATRCFSTDAAECHRGRAASEGALAPEPPSATRFQERSRGARRRRALAGSC